MAKYGSLAALFSAIANAIRAKTGDTDTIVAEDFPTAIEGISGGGGCGDGDYEIPHTFVYEGKTYLFLPGQVWDDWLYVKGGNNAQGDDFINFQGMVAAKSHIWWDDEAGDDYGNPMEYPDGAAVSVYDLIQAIEYI